MAKNLKGMTLVEVLFATAIFSFVSITLFVLFKLGQTYWGRGMSYNQIQNDMKKTVTLLEKYLKQSDFNSIIIVNVTSGRDAVFATVQNERNEYKYIGFVPTADMVPPDQTGYLYFIYFGYSNNYQSYSVNQVQGVTRNTINNISTNLQLNGNRKTILLSDNLGSFRVSREQQTIRITLNFLKRTIGEATNQAIGASVFIIPLNKFQ